MQNNTKNNQQILTVGTLMHDLHLVPCVLDIVVNDLGIGDLDLND